MLPCWGRTCPCTEKQGRSLLIAPALRCCTNKTTLILSCVLTNLVPLSRYPFWLRGLPGALLIGDRTLDKATPGAFPDKAASTSLILNRQNLRFAVLSIACAGNLPLRVRAKT